jgi:hypothetical protein
LNPKRPVLRWTSGRRFPAKCAFFMRLMREPRKLKTRWRSELNSNSRATNDYTCRSRGCITGLFGYRRVLRYPPNVPSG